MEKWISTFDIGLIQIHGSCTAEHCIESLKKCVINFGFDQEIGMTIDGASKSWQTCLLLLATMFCTWYTVNICGRYFIPKKLERDLKVTEKSFTDLNLVDNEGDMKEINEVQSLTVTIDRQSAKVIFEYIHVIKKV